MFRKIKKITWRDEATLKEKDKEGNIYVNCIGPGEREKRERLQTHTLILNLDFSFFQNQVYEKLEDSKE